MTTLQEISDERQKVQTMMQVLQYMTETLGHAEVRIKQQLGITVDQYNNPTKEDQVVHYKKEKSDNKKSKSDSKPKAEKLKVQEKTDPSVKKKKYSTDVITIEDTPVHKQSPCKKIDDGELMLGDKQGSSKAKKHPRMQPAKRKLEELLDKIDDKKQEEEDDDDDSEITTEIPLKPKKKKGIENKGKKILHNDLLMM
jgi:hypothetical protein